MVQPRSRHGCRWPAALFAVASLFAASLSAEPGQGQGEARQRQVGRQLVARLGCAGCHALAGPGIDQLGSAGPDLRRIAAKTTPSWARAFILAPRSMQAASAMPHFLDEQGAADAEAIVAYLWHRSARPAYPAPPDGDPERGHALFEAVGCTGCHLREPGVKRHDVAAPERLQGPDLAHLGTKVDAGWLYAWLLDPRGYAPETAMPSLRLEASEAADLTAFLLGSRGPATEPFALPPQADPRQVAAGREALALYGCYGCHRIAGFEQAERPAGPWSSLAGFSGHGMAGLPDFALSTAELEAIRMALAATDAIERPALARGRWLIARAGCRGCHRIEGTGQAMRATVSDHGMLPPDLRGEGSRVQKPWLAAYLADPGQHLLRAWLEARMPSFSLTATEIDTLVAYFIALEPRPLAEVSPGPASPETVALGREAYQLMPCGRCHPSRADLARQRASGSALDAASLAPPLELARRRLRWGWIAPWLKDPQAWSPATKMPTFFTQAPPGVFHSPFSGALDAPLFAPARARMLAHVAPPAALEAFLDDPDAVIAALRDYVWSLGQASAEVEQPP